jgi:hypothetical protein
MKRLTDDNILDACDALVEKDFFATVVGWNVSVAE